MRVPSIRSILDLAVTIILGTAALLVIWRTVVPSRTLSGPPRKEAVEDVRASGLSTPIVGTIIKGDPRASVVLVEFSDFECPFCEKYVRESFELIDRNFVATGRLRYAFRHFPLEEIHANALAASEAAECASRQEKFWQVHRLFFARQKDLSQRFWQSEAQSIGLNSAILAGCLEGAALKKVREDIAEGQRLGVNSTPTFVLGVIQPDGRVSVSTKIRGAQPYEVFEKAIKATL